MKRRDGILRGRKGASLVEVLVAMLILVTMVIATGAYLIHVQSSVALQRNKRMATEIASARLEAIRADRYERIRPPATDYQTYYISGVPGAWTLSTSDPVETVAIRGLERPMRSTVKYEDVDGGGNSYDMVRVAVEVSYRTDLNSRVLLESLVSPMR